jgi:2-dehydro-3-deoxyphosphooctonate aldolase (KDO 8-P synthase)
MPSVQVGQTSLGPQQPLCLIAGPCVLENRDLVFRTAEAVLRTTTQLGMPYIFKSSFDKANRSTLGAARGPGLHEGLELLAAVRKEFDVPVCTDFHEPGQVRDVADVVDLLQIPAFLSRQTDMLLAAARSGKPTSVKKGQFLSPWEMRNVVEKFTASGNEALILIERGTSFGYGNLVLDLRSLAVMRELGYPVVLDATHCAQLPGAAGLATGGQREFIPTLVRGGVAAGIDALFMEVHPDPERGLSDAATMWPIDRLQALLSDAQRIHEAAQTGESG